MKYRWYVLHSPHSGYYPDSMGPTRRSVKKFARSFGGNWRDFERVGWKIEGVGEPRPTLFQRVKAWWRG